MQTDQASLKRFRYLVFALVAGLAVFRLWYAQTIPLSEDEANSWQWSRHLSFGYYDQGPMIAWMVAIGTGLFGHTEFGVRFMAPLLMAGVSLLFWDFCRRVLKDEWLGLWLAVAVNAVVLFAAGGVIHTYDTVQAFLWLATLHLVGVALFNDKPLAWYPAGVAIGLAMLSKYHSVLLPAAILGFLACTPDLRHWLKRKEPWLATLIGALVFSPNLWWNYVHHWTAFGLTMGHVKSGFKPAFFEFLGGQAGLIGPVLFVMMVMGWARAWGLARRGDHKASYLLWTSLPVLALFTLLSLKGRVQANWPGPVYLGGILAAAWALRQPLRQSGKWRKWAAAALISGFLFCGVAYFHVPVLKAVDFPAENDPTGKLYGWPAMGKAIGEVLARWPGKEKPFIFATNYQLASLAAFYTPGQPRTWGLFLPGDRLNVYLFWGDPGKLKGRDGLAIWHGEPHLSGLCESGRVLRRLELVGPTGKVMHRVNLAKCTRFRGKDARPARFLPLAEKW